MPLLLGIVWGASFATIAILLFLGRPFVVALFIGLLVFLQTILALIIGRCVTGLLSSRNSLDKVILTGILVFVASVNIYALDWLRTPGSDQHLVNHYSKLTKDLDAANPGLMGDYSVELFYYGSGQDKRRYEYGQGVDYQTSTVDMSPFVPKLPAWQSHYRNVYWGFDLASAPLNGRVWYPQGEGPFPLVLIAHANHAMEDYSDPGYGYLGELLASRGYIVVSLDQNFLNFSMLGGDFSGGEVPARALLILEHLQLWRSWNNNHTHTFFGKVDLDNIALIGHSRGGEAVAAATVLNSLKHFPEDANIVFDYGFSIKSVVAMAPSDQFYKPAGQPIVLEDVNYLLLHGAHDGDVFVAMGNEQYDRVHFNDDYRFKSMVYIYQGNHSQFNQDWGRRDLSPPHGWLLNTKPIMSGTKQRQVAQVYISAFLDSTIRGNNDYLPFFRNHTKGAQWLPETIYVTRFQDSSYRIVSDFETVDISRTSLPGGEHIGDNLQIWRHEKQTYRFGLLAQNNQVMKLGWNEKGSLTIILPPVFNDWQLNTEDALVFSMANLGNSQLDFSIQIRFQNGQVVKVGLQEMTYVPPELKVRVTKLGLVEENLMKPSEAILQSYELPLGNFLDHNSQALDHIHSITFQFDRTPYGKVWLDDVGFRLNTDSRSRPTFPEYAP